MLIFSHKMAVTPAPVTQAPGVPLGSVEGEQTYGIIAILAALGGIIVFGGIAMCCYGRWAANKLAEEKALKADDASAATSAAANDDAATVEVSAVPPYVESPKQASSRHEEDIEMEDV